MGRVLASVRYQEQPAVTLKQPGRGRMTEVAPERKAELKAPKIRRVGDRRLKFSLCLKKPFELKRKQNKGEARST